MVQLDPRDYLPTWLPGLEPIIEWILCLESELERGCVPAEDALGGLDVVGREDGIG